MPDAVSENKLAPAESGNPVLSSVPSTEIKDSKKTDGTNTDVLKVDDKPADGAAPSSETKPDDKPKVVPKWFQDRFDEMTKSQRIAEREKEALIEQNAQLLTQLAAAKKPSDSANPAPIQPKAETVAIQRPQDIERLVNERAAAIALSNQFNETCNAVAEAGEKEFTKESFGESMKVLSQIGLIESPDKPQIFLEVVTSIPNSHRLLQHLGRNPDEAARLRSLPPVRIAAELARMEVGLSKPRDANVSGAPAPIKPLNATSKTEVDIYDKDIPMSQWVEARRKQRAAKRAGN